MMEKLNPREAYERLIYLRQEAKTDTNAQHELEELQNNYDWKNQIFEENGKKGLKDILGNILIPPLFHEIENNDHSLLDNQYVRAFVVTNENSAYKLVASDGSGRVLYEAPNDSFIDELVPRVFLITDGEGLYGLIDNEGKEYCPCKYPWHIDINSFPDIPKDVICILCDNKFSFLLAVPEFDETGKRCGTNFKFTGSIYSDYEGAYIGNEYEVMASRGRIKPRPDNLTVLYNGIWGFFDKNGDFTVDREKAYVGIFPDLEEDEFDDNYERDSEYDDDGERSFGRYRGTYAQDEAGYSDEEIDDIFDGEPSAYWNID